MPAARPRPRPKRIEQLEEYVRACAATLGLSAWTIEVDREPAAQGCAAQILDEMPLHARLWVSRIFWRSTPEFQRSIVVHELAHLAGCALNAPVEQVQAALGKQAAAAIVTSIHGAEHALIAWLEPLLSQLVPLPPPFARARSPR